MATVTDKKPFEFIKQPSEKEIIGVDFARRVPAGVTIVNVEGNPGVGYGVTVSTYVTGPVGTAGGGDPDPLIVVPGLTIVTRKVLSCMISGGSDGFTYRCTFIVTLSDQQIKEEDVFVKVVAS